MRAVAATPCGGTGNKTPFLESVSAVLSPPGFGPLGRSRDEIFTSREFLTPLPSAVEMFTVAKEIKSEIINLYLEKARHLLNYCL